MSVSYMYMRENGGSDRPILAKVRDGEELKAWVEFRGTVQKGFYEVRKDGNQTPVACFFTMQEGVTFAKQRFCF